MNSFMSNFALDAWYKFMVWIFSLLFIATAAGALPNLATVPTLLISIGGILFSVGEWINHPLQTFLEYASGQRFISSGNPRKFTILGTLFNLAGLFLAGKGIYLVRVASTLRKLPEDAIKHLNLKLLDLGVAHLPNALHAIQTALHSL